MYIPYRKAYLTSMNPLSFVTFFTFGELGMMTALAMSAKGVEPLWKELVSARGVREKFHYARAYWIETVDTTGRGIYSTRVHIWAFARLVQAKAAGVCLCVGSPGLQGNGSTGRNRSRGQHSSVDTNRYTSPGSLPTWGIELRGDGIPKRHCRRILV